MIYTIHPIRMIRKTPKFLPAIAGIALMTITACGSAAVSDFTKSTQDAAIAAAVATAQAEAASVATQAATAATTAQNLAVATARAEEKQIAQTAQGIAVDAVRCTTPVCDNVVNTADLPSFPTTVTSNSSTFLTIAGTEINITGVTASGGVAPTINRATRAGDNMDGFRYFSGQFGGTGSTGYFAGILPTTNLGAPLSTPPTTTAWPGTYSQGAGGATNITFNIDFANKRITALDAPGGSLAVRFNLGFSDSGVISGVVLGHVGLTGGENISSFAIATGLIGTEGLVGIFIEDDSYPSSGYVGGFVAANPSP